jgi:hypothetical protein
VIRENESPDAPVFYSDSHSLSIAKIALKQNFIEPSLLQNVAIYANLGYQQGRIIMVGVHEILLQGMAIAAFVAFILR